MLLPSQPHACEVCQSKLLFQSNNRCPEKGWWELITEAGPLTDDEYGYWFNLWYGEAIELAESGCELMAWLVTLHRPDTTSDSQLRAYFIRNFEEQLVLDWVEEIGQYTISKELGPKLVLCAEADNVAAADIKPRLPNLNPSSAETMSKARAWLQACTDTHEACVNREFDKTRCATTDVQALKPRRLIKISKWPAGSIMFEHPEICLVDTTYIPWPKYATLSYCWGGDQEFKLVKRILTTWHSRISFSHFPQTIKDAIIVTAELGLEYLWVDALCIIQDDDADKGVELAKMGNIYSEAHVTLLASRSPGVRHGFLNSRYIPGERGYRLPYLCADGQAGSVVLWAGRDVGTAEPIHQRGWCFQEHVLSPRILEFGTHQLRYLCSANRTEEIAPETDGWAIKSETSAQYGTGLSLDLPASWYTLPMDGIDFCILWSRIIMHYSGLSLTYNTDKLRAISAIARKFEQASSVRYYAGIWEEHLLSQLFWETATEYSGLQKATRSTEYAAPSWSWASMQGPISCSESRDSAAYETLNIFVDNSTPGDDFSDVISAELRLRTLTLHARITENEGPSQAYWDSYAEMPYLDMQFHKASWEAQNALYKDYPCEGFTFKDPESGMLWKDLSAQWDEFTKGDHTVLLAQITVEKGLILKSQPHCEKKYTRVGTYFLRTWDGQPDYGWKQRDIVIV